MWATCLDQGANSRVGIGFIRPLDWFEGCVKTTILMVRGINIKDTEMPVSWAKTAPKHRPLHLMPRYQPSVATLKVMLLSFHFLPYSLSPSFPPTAPYPPAYY